LVALVVFLVLPLLRVILLVLAERGKDVGLTECAVWASSAAKKA
jgi:hypothetical protein